MQQGYCLVFFICLVFLSVSFFFFLFWSFSWPSQSRPLVQPSWLYPCSHPRKLCQTLESFQADYYRPLSLALITACLSDSVNSGHGCSRFWLLPWPLMIFWQGHLKQIGLCHVHQSINWLMAWVFYRNIGLEGVLIGHSQYQTPLILTGDIQGKPPNLGSFLVSTRSFFWNWSRYCQQR